MSATHSSFTPQNGPQLHVVRQGQGTPFLFQHGLCGSALQTAEVFPNDSGFQCVTVEMHGHGQSEAGDPSRFSIATFADNCATYIAQHYDAPIVIGGISMGAAIALRLAVTRPELVRGLVIARPAWVVDAAPENMRPNAEVGALLNSHTRETAIAIFKSSTRYAELTKDAPDNLASLMGFFDRTPQPITAALLEQISADGPGVGAAQLSALNIPTLIFGHERDVIHPLAHAIKLAQLIPHAQLVQITPKATDKSRYVLEFQSALLTFLKDF